MLKIAFSLIAMSLLAGCASTSSEKQNQLTLDAIKQSESNIANEIEILKLGLSNQSDYIASLETEVIGLQSKVSALQHTATKLESTQKAPSNKRANDTQLNIGSTSPSNNLVVLGAVENIQLEKIDQRYSARIDTGSTTSSLNAINIKEFEREGKRWVRFNLNELDTDIEGKTKLRPLLLGMPILGNRTQKQ